MAWYIDEFGQRRVPLNFEQDQSRKTIRNKKKCYPLSVDEVNAMNNYLVEQDRALEKEKTTIKKDDQLVIFNKLEDMKLKSKLINMGYLKFDFKTPP